MQHIRISVRVILQTIQKNPVERRTRTPFRHLDERSPHIRGGELYTGHVPHHRPLSAQKNERERMRVDLLVLDPVIPEPYCFRKRRNRSVLSRKKMPSLCGFGLAQHIQVHSLPLRSQRRCFERVETHRHDIELIAGRPGHLLQRFGQPVQHHIAHGGTLVINQRQQHRTFAVEVLSEGNLFPVLVPKNKVTGRLGADPLVKANPFELRRQRACRLPECRSNCNGQHRRTGYDPCKQRGQKPPGSSPRLGSIWLATRYHLLRYVTMYSGA